MAPWQLLAVIGAGWMSRQQQQVIEYLREENRVLREKLGKSLVLPRWTYLITSHAVATYPSRDADPMFS